VQQYACHAGTNQQWRLSAPPTDRATVTLTAVHSGQCLDVAGAYAMYRYYQDSDDFAVYDAQGNWLWSSGTWLSSGGRMVFREYGDLATYNPSGYRFWHTNTFGY
jgi:hypothetical protein